MKTFYIHKLGCPKNDVDADYISGFLQKNNLIPVFEPEKADLLIVNTCAFIQPAKEESIEAALDLVRLKKNGTAKKIILTGCLSQRYTNELKEEIPELDGIFGINNVADIPGVFSTDRRQLTARTKNPRIYSEPGFLRAVNDDEHFAYLKISEGCDNRCSYCAIPDIRGRFRSRRIEAIVDEARFLIENGKRELILVSQETTAYGRDIYDKPRILTLLDSLCELEGDFWLRIMYLHPARLQNDLIDYMIDNQRICSYFDLPLQHISDRLLGLMNRKVGRARIENLLDRIRSRGEETAIRTTFILGFPGETEAEFTELCDFVESQRFERLGAFIYSAEEATPAYTFEGRIGEDVAGERYARLMMLQQDISFEINEAAKNREMEVLVERVDSEKGISIGRTRFDAPEIDQTVRLDFTDVAPGSFIRAHITGYDGYDLLGCRGNLI